MTKEYTPCFETVDGAKTDMLIEEMLNLIYQNYYDADNFDQVFTSVVRAHINPDCPDLMASHAGKHRINIGAVHYLAMLRLDYSVINSVSLQWQGPFEYLPDAKVSVSIHYPDKDYMSNAAPGLSINQAALASIMQYAREIAHVRHNEPELPMKQKYDA